MKKRSGKQFAQRAIEPKTHYKRTKSMEKEERRKTHKKPLQCQTRSKLCTTTPGVLFTCHSTHNQNLKYTKKEL